VDVVVTADAVVVDAAPAGAVATDVITAVVAVADAAVMVAATAKEIEEHRPVRKEPAFSFALAISSALLP
jgi:hypothetical protein